MRKRSIWKNQCICHFDYQILVYFLIFSKLIVEVLLLLTKLDLYPEHFVTDLQIWMRCLCFWGGVKDSIHNLTSHHHIFIFAINMPNHFFILSNIMWGRQYLVSSWTITLRNSNKLALNYAVKTKFISALRLAANYVGHDFNIWICYCYYKSHS